MTAPKFKIGDVVAVKEEETSDVSDHWESDPEYPGTVVEVGRADIRIRFPALPRWDGSETLWFRKQDCVVVTTTTDSPTRPLGTPPEGDFIRPDDPRLDWLWRDAETLANREGVCSQYDAFCERLGIPGREKMFDVSHPINGLVGSFQVSARSQMEADAKVAAALAENAK